MKENDLRKYTKLVSLRNILKEIQQLSWNITQLDKKYPIEKAESIGYDELIEAYMSFREPIISISEKFENEIFEDRFLETEVFPNLTKNRKKQ